MKPWRIFVAIDESPHAAVALDHAASLASSLNAPVVVAHAVDVRAAILPDVGIASEEILKGMRDAGRGILDQALKRLAPTHPGAEALLLEGVVADEIVAAATKWNASFIVIGTHGRTGLSRLLMGSTAENVLRHAPMPVLVVPTRTARS